MSGNTQRYRTAKRFGLQGHLAQVRQELALGLVVRMAHELSALNGLARQFATACHGLYPLSSEVVQHRIRYEPRQNLALCVTRLKKQIGVYRVEDREASSETSENMPRAAPKAKTRYAKAARLTTCSPLQEQIEQKFIQCLRLKFPNSLILSAMADF